MTSENFHKHVIQKGMEVVYKVCSEQVETCITGDLNHEDNKDPVRSGDLRHEELRHEDHEDPVRPGNLNHEELNHEDHEDPVRSGDLRHEELNHEDHEDPVRSGDLHHRGHASQLRRCVSPCMDGHGRVNPQ